MIFTGAYSAGRPPGPGDRHRAGSLAAGQALGDIAWPPGYIPVSVLDNRTLRDPDPAITLVPGDRVSLLARI